MPSRRPIPKPIREPSRRRKSLKNSLAKFSKRLHRSTGISFNRLMIACVLLPAVLVGIGLTVLYTNTQQAGEVSGIEGVESKRLTGDEQFVEMSELPPDFSAKLPVEKIDILNFKIEAGEGLAMSGSPYAERAIDRLVSMHGVLSRLQELEGINSQKSCERLAELRQQALAAGNEQRIAVADFHLAFAATSRLNRNTEPADFHFAAEAVSNLDSKNLVSVPMLIELSVDATKLHDNSPKQDSTAIFLSLLGDKLIGSPVTKIAELGQNLKDYPTYARYNEAITKPPYTTRESKIEFYRELFAEIEKAPPQAFASFQIVIQLLERLQNKSDGHFAGLLTKQLAKAASQASPAVRSAVDQSISRIEKRLGMLGETADLSGSNFRGSSLQLPNGKPTVLVFWGPRNKKSREYLSTFANTGRFNPWGTNVLIASTSPQPAEQLQILGKNLGKFTVLDNETSRRLANDFAIEHVPYQVSIDEKDKVVWLDAPRD